MILKWFSLPLNCAGKAPRCAETSRRMVAIVVDLEIDARACAALN
jgi:hypothetical protein